MRRHVAGLDGAAISAPAAQGLTGSDPVTRRPRIPSVQTVPPARTTGGDLGERDRPPLEVVGSQPTEPDTNVEMAHRA
jgi:hypothetical protein